MTAGVGGCMGVVMHTTTPEEIPTPRQIAAAMLRYRKAAEIQIEREAREGWMSGWYGSTMLGHLETYEDGRAGRVPEWLKPYIRRRRFPPIPVVEG